MNLSIDEAKDILRDTLHQLHSGGSFQTARQEAANDMLKYMRNVFPIATEIQKVILANRGYTSPHDLVRFTQLVRDLERHDRELSHLYNELRHLVMPQMDMVKVPRSSGLQTNPPVERD